MAVTDYSRLNLSRIVSCLTIFLVVVIPCTYSSKNEYQSDVGKGVSSYSYNFELLPTSHRVRREPPPTPAPTPVSNKSVEKPLVKTPHDASAPAANATTTLGTYVTSTHQNVGVNGSGIRKDVNANVQVSQPITAHHNNGSMPDDGIKLTDVLKTVDEPDEKIPNTVNVTNLKSDNHTFYNSTWYTDPAYFEEYWKNITSQQSGPQAALSKAYRKAITLQLRFDFPYYGVKLRTLTVATGGFIYTGEQIHMWLAATQYIAPLMANFDTITFNDSVIRVTDNGVDTCTVIWEKMHLPEAGNKTFTFALVLRKNGDIEFAYKDLPIRIQDIDDKDHPVKVGLSDAYFIENVIFYIRHKTIYEYHRITFAQHDIKNGTVLKFTALPNCQQYESCDACVNHKTSFDCSWCPKLKSCSNGFDRNRQNWQARRCDVFNMTTSAMCSSNGAPTNTTVSANNNTAYIIAKNDVPSAMVPISVPEAAGTSQANAGSASFGGVAAVLTAVAFATAIAAWILYAYTHPHTASGQMLIKYRPSQWNWRRGEARYTAATIHM